MGPIYHLHRAGGPLGNAAPARRGHSLPGHRIIAAAAAIGCICSACSSGGNKSAHPAEADKRPPAASEVPAQTGNAASTPAAPEAAAGGSAHGTPVQVICDWEPAYNGYGYEDAEYNLEQEQAAVLRHFDPVHCEEEEWERTKEPANLESLSLDQVYLDTLLPLARDAGTEATLFGVVNAEWLDYARGSGNASFHSGDTGAGCSIDEPYVVLRVGEDYDWETYEGTKSGIYAVNWSGNARFAENPWLDVQDFDGDGEPEAAMCLYTGWGTAFDVHELCLADLDTLEVRTPSMTELDVEAEWVEDTHALTLHGGELSATLELEPGEGLDHGRLYYGDIVDFEVKDGRVMCCLALMLPFEDSDHGSVPCFEIEAPVIWSPEEQRYRLGDPIRVEPFK